MASTPTNFVFILADDMGYGDFARVNGGMSRTPSIDRLMGEGLSFTQQYSASPVCAPARAALLTGRYPQRTGVIDTLEARGTDRLALRESTIADELRTAGYTTGLVGKWHNGAIGAQFHPARRGFDEFCGFRGGWQDYWDWRIEIGGRTVQADGRYLTDVFGDEAISFVERHRTEPFFLHLAFNAPHFPFQAPAEAVDSFRSAGVSTAVATIYAMIEAMDRNIGRVLDTLDRLGLAENTVVVFTSDNGPQMDGVGEASTHRFNAGLAGSKQHVYEGGIRLPLVFRWPGHVEAGGQTDAFVHSTDWAPTLLQIAGTRRRSRLPLDGRPITDVLDGGASDDGPRFWQWTRYRPLLASNAAIRDGDWKLVHPALGETLGLEPADQRADELIKRHPEEFPDAVDEPQPDYSWLESPTTPLLFNLSRDPGETTNLADAEPQRVKVMEARLAAWFEEVETERKQISG